jgi:hypothetical protein
MKPFQQYIVFILFVCLFSQGCGGSQVPAVNLLEAAIAGDAAAQVQLAEKSLAEAKVWLRQAALQKQPMAIELLSRLDNQVETTGIPKLELPLEVWAHVLSYIKYPEILTCRQLNHSFYERITGDNRIGILGAANKPNLYCEIENFQPLPVIDFNKAKYKDLTPADIYSFFFYNLIQKAKNLPHSFWPYVKGTRIKEIDLEHNNIGDDKFIGLINSLKGSEVQYIGLGNNGIQKIDASSFNQALQNTNISNINLHANKLTDHSVIEFFRGLKGTKVLDVTLTSTGIECTTRTPLLIEVLKETPLTSVSLWGNALGDAGALIVLKALKGTNINWINLGNNNIKFDAGSAFNEALKDTNLHTLHLEKNNIENKAAEIASMLQGTNILLIGLNNCGIDDQGAIKLIQYLATTKVRRIMLDSNKITGDGTLGLADVLEGTAINEIDLEKNLVGTHTQAVLKKLYPNIKWNF